MPIREKSLEEYIEEFRRENPDIREALEILRVSNEEYLRAIEAAYGVSKTSASSTRPSR